MERSMMLTQEPESGKMVMSVPLSNFALIRGVGPSMEGPWIVAITPASGAGAEGGWGSMALMEGTLEQGM